MHGQRKYAPDIASPLGMHPYGRAWRYGVVFLLVHLLAPADGVSNDTGAAPTVITKWGSIRGKWGSSLRHRQFASFIGIPYALPPLGDLRFRSPQRWNHTWIETYNATADGPKCVQLNQDLDIIGSEDCLYLNVYVPTESSKILKNPRPILPVLVFIHGGGFAMGSSSSTQFPPDYLMDHEAIVVTLNYRLNALGFFSTTNQVAPGNYGLKDMMMALRWVQENIRSFGGDSGSVTVMGTSAGSGSAHLLSLSKKTEGLFGKLILQSGNGVALWGVRDRKIYRQVCLELAESVGCLSGKGNDASNRTTTEKLEEENKRSNVVWNNVWNNHKYQNVKDDEKMMKCMRTVDVKKIQEGIKRFFIWRQNPICVFAPTLEEDSEDAILTTHPIKTMRDGLFRDIPTMIQLMKNEGLLKTIDFFVDLKAQNEMIENFEQYLPFLLEYQESISDISTFAAAIRDFYFNGNLTLNFMKNVTDMASDALMVWPAKQLLQYLLKFGKSKIYFSIFAYEGTFSHTMLTGSPNHYGVAHGDDLFYIFPPTAKIFKDLSLYNTENDITMIHIMTEMITSFVQKGVPKGWMNPAWPNYRDHHLLMRFGIGKSPDIMVQAAFTFDRMEFWNKLIANVAVGRDISVGGITGKIAGESVKASAGTIGRELMIHLGFLTIIHLYAQ